MQVEGWRRAQSKSQGSGKSQTGHRGIATAETVYRKVIVPELRRGAEVMDRLFT
jgi:hypothetical protein